MKIQWHILFWVIYLIVESFIIYNTGEWRHRSFMHSIVYHGSLLVPRVIISYAFITYILPFLTKGRLHILIRIILVILFFALGLFIYRAFLNLISWPLIMNHAPQFNPFDVRLSSYSFLRMVSPLSFLLAILYVHKAYILKLRNEQLQKERLQSELNYLKAQINPHFLFNSFNNLYVLALDKSEKTAPAIEKLSSLFRYILQSSSKEEITIKDEIKVMENYVALERLRYQNLDITLNKQIHDGHQNIPPLLMLPFIENAFKHGASELVEGGKVFIEIIQQKDSLTLHCTNTTESTKSLTSSKSGNGIKNATKRLDLLFGKKYQLEQGIVGNEYQVTLSFPVSDGQK